MSNPDLPEDNVVEILARLPVKSLLRFKSVCKPWRSRISNPRFIKMHMERTTSNPMNNSFIAHDFQTQDFHPYKFHAFNYQPSLGNHILSLININFHNNAVELNLPFPTSTNQEGFFVVGSCNGLLCIGNDSSGLHLWNPASRQLKDIQKCTIEVEDFGDHISLGFGFDHASNDYKVVRIITNLLRFPAVSRVEVYSLNENSWKEIEVELEFKMIQPLCAAIVKGLPYWLAEDISVPKRFILVSFDVQSEKFCKVSVSDGILGHGMLIGILEFKESVAIIVCSKYHEMEIWALDDDSSGRSCWIKKLNFMISPVFKGLVGCLKTGELITQTFLNELVLYDPGNQVFKQTHNQSQFRQRTLRTYNYIESLVSLN